MKKWIVYRETYSTIEIEARTEEEATNVMSDLDGDDDGWEYYKEEIFLEPEAPYNEYSMTHTVDRDDDVNDRIQAIEYETKKISSSLLSFKKHTSDRMLRNRLEALDKIGKLELLTQKLIDIQVTEDVDRHDDLIDELWVYKK
jgi:hypothetical protein